MSSLFPTIWFDPGGTTGWAVFTCFGQAMPPPPIIIYARMQPDYEEAKAAGPGTAPYQAIIDRHARELNTSRQYPIFSNIKFWAAGEYTGSEDDQVDEMVKLVRVWPEAAVGCEDFILRVYRRDRSLLSPVRIIAKLEREIRYTGAWERRRSGAGRRLILQQPSLAMTTITDDRLKRMVGMWIANKPHARDAERHALTFLQREKAARLQGQSLMPYPPA